MKHNSRLIVALLAGTCSLPAVVSAQAADATAPAEDEGFGLEEVVVTAQRVEETVQRAAIAISVVQPKDLVNVTNPADLAKAVPSLQFANTGGAAPLMYVRGVGTFATNPYTDSAIAVNYDGVYIGRPTSTIGLFYDLERVEVLKGPQGTLYGRNATGGALNVIPAKPKLAETSVTGSLSYGNFDAYNAQGAVNVDLSDTAAMRVAAIKYEHDGYNTDGTLSGEGTGGRIQLLLQPSDALSLRLSGDYFKLGGSTGPVIAGVLDPQTGQTIPTNFNGEVGPVDPRTTALLSSIFVGSAGAVYGPLYAPSRDNEYYGLTGELKADLGWAQLTVLPAWRKSELDAYDVATGFNIATVETDEQYSLEARLSGSAGPIDWLGGLYYFDEDVAADFVPNQIVFGGVQTFVATNKSYAGFGRLVWNVTDTFRLTGAARYTEDEKDFAGVSTFVQAICTDVSHQCPAIRRLPRDIRDLNAALASIGYVPGLIPLAPGISVPGYVDAPGYPMSNVGWSPGTIEIDRSLSFNKVTYRAAAEFEPREDSLLYASFETGYRSGGFAFSTIRPEYDPETIDAITLGSKNRFLDNRMQLNVELFRWKYKDQQLHHASIGATGGLEFTTENIGESTNQGVEVEVVARPLLDTIVRASVQYLDAKNDSFVYREVDQSSLAGLPPGTLRPDSTCPSSIIPGAGAYRIDCSGLRGVNSPEWTGNLGVEQTILLPNEYKFVAEASTHYQTSSITMFERRALGTQPTYWMSNASLGFGPQDDQWRVTAWIENIEDERVGAFVYNNITGVTSGLYDAPRTYGMRVQFQF